MEFQPFILNKVVIDNDVNEIDITPNNKSIEIYESIFQAFLSGEIFFSDDGYYFEEYTFIGNEKITLSFSLTDGDEEYEQTFEFVILNFDKIESNDDSIGKKALYKIEFTDVNGLNAINQFSYSFSDTLISEMVKKISKNMIGKTIDFFEKTKGNFSKTFPYMTPIEMIKELQKDAINNKNQYGYLFFSDNEQKLHYQSINYLFSQDASFDLVTNIKTSNNISPNAFKAHEYSKYLNIKNNIMNGVLGNNYDYFDLSDKSVKTVNNTLENLQNSMALTGKRGFISKELDKYKNHDFDINKNYHFENKALFSLIDNNYNLYTKQIGNFYKKAGQTSNIDFMSLLPENKEDGLSDDVFSGKWLCKEIIHKIDNEGYYIYPTYIKNSLQRLNRNIQNKVY